MPIDTNARYYQEARAEAISDSSKEQTKYQLAKFGGAIKARRQTWAMSQRHLALLAGTTQSVIAQIEAGRGNPTIGLLTRITHALPGAQLELRLFNDYQGRK